MDIWNKYAELSARIKGAYGEHALIEYYKRDKKTYRFLF